MHPLQTSQTRGHVCRDNVGVLGFHIGRNLNIDNLDNTQFEIVKW